MLTLVTTLVTTTNTQIHANYVHLTSPQQCVKYTDFSKSKFRSYDPWKQTPEYTHFSFLMCTIHTYIIHKLFINLCNCRTTVSVLYRFRDIAGYLSEVADFDPPNLHSAPS